jgi:hypothetical protein
MAEGDGMSPRHLAHVGLAVATVLSVGASGGAFKRYAMDRLYMIVLREGTDEDTLPDIQSRFERDFRLKWGGTFTRGALIGVLAEMDAERASALRSDHAVERVQKVLPQMSSPPPPEVGGKFLRAVPGWAVPGSYIVSLVTDEWKVTFTRWASPLPMPPPSPKPIDPDWRAKDDAKKAAVRAVADELIAAYGGRFVINLAPSSPAFSCAMTEAQALAMAADPRVANVGESSYTLVD